MPNLKTPDTSSRSPAKSVDLAGLVGTLVLVALLSSLTILKPIKQCLALSREQKDLTKRLIESSNLSLTLAEAGELLGDHETWVEKPRRYLPEKMDMEDFYAFLTETSRNNRLILESVEPTDVVENTEENYLETLVMIEALASFRDFHKFLYTLMNRPGRLTQLESLSIQPADNPDLCDINLQIKLLAASPGQLVSTPPEEN